MRLRRMLTTALALFAASACTAVAHPEPHHPQPGAKDDLRKARDATREFRDVDAARAAGYKATGECTHDPKYGGMGIHYTNDELVADGKLDVRKPEILVYQPTRRGTLRLGAVEYFQVDADQDLHVWLYRHNPAGRFAMWNPTVRCPEGAR